MSSYTRAIEGRPVRIPAAAYNAWCAAAEANERSGHRSGGADGSMGPHALRVRVKNATGEQLAAFATVAAAEDTAAALTITGNEYAVTAGPLLRVTDAELDDNPRPHLVVLQEPIPDGEVGWGVIRGVCVARVDVGNALHRYADLPSTGAKLRSAVQGRVRILQGEAGGAGERLCLVDVSQLPPSAVDVRIEGPATGGIYPGLYVQRGETFPYTYAATDREVRVLPVGGGTLQQDRVYQGTVVGAVTLSGTTYDLVDVVGDANTTAGSPTESAWAGGLLNTTKQSIKGEKTFRDAVTVAESDLSSLFTVSGATSAQVALDSQGFASVTVTASPYTGSFVVNPTSGQVGVGGPTGGAALQANGNYNGLLAGNGFVYQPAAPGGTGEVNVNYCLFLSGDGLTRNSTNPLPGGSLKGTTRYGLARDGAAEWGIDGTYTLAISPSGSVTLKFVGGILVDD